MNSSAQYNIIDVIIVHLAHLELQNWNHYKLTQQIFCVCKIYFVVFFHYDFYICIYVTASFTDLHTSTFSYVWTETKSDIHDPDNTSIFVLLLLFSPKNDIWNRTVTETEKETNIAFYLYSSCKYSDSKGIYTKIYSSYY